MLSDEEKKAIKEVNHFKELTRYWQEEEYEEKEIAGYIGIILNLIEKQQKEIERLEARKYILNAETGEISQISIDNNYISKDKIKSKVIEIKNRPVKDEFITVFMLDSEKDVITPKGYRINII